MVRCSSCFSMADHIFTLTHQEGCHYWRAYVALDDWAQQALISRNSDPELAKTVGAVRNLLETIGVQPFPKD